MRIVTHPDPGLRLNLVKEAVGMALVPPTEAFIGEMVETMYLGHGVGLAAPQVGLQYPMFVMDPSAGEESDKLEIVMRPVILERQKETDEDVEGCLSLPGITGTVSRARRIAVRYSTPAGQTVERMLEGFAARVFQHEYDHLCGVLYVDHIPTFSRKLLLRDYAKLREHEAF